MHENIPENNYENIHENVHDKSFHLSRDCTFKDSNLKCEIRSGHSVWFERWEYRKETHIKKYKKIGDITEDLTPCDQHILKATHSSFCSNHENRKFEYHS